MLPAPPYRFFVLLDTLAYVTSDRVRAVAAFLDRRVEVALARVAIVVRAADMHWSFRRAAERDLNRQKRNCSSAVHCTKLWIWPGDSILDSRVFKHIGIED